MAKNRVTQKIDKFLTNENYTFSAWQMDDIIEYQYTSIDLAEDRDRFRNSF